MPVHIVWLKGLLLCLDNMKEEFLSVIHCFAFDCSDFFLKMFLPIKAKKTNKLLHEVQGVQSVIQDLIVTGS